MHEILVSSRATYYSILFPLFVLSPTFLHRCNAFLRYSDLHIRISTICDIRTDSCYLVNRNNPSVTVIIIRDLGLLSLG